ncbi:MAG: VCBS repeat-containing protein, partial [Planctomycetes bacterium]|nr:VCBS repeat-containing protein [Planctomycetota bacterium]
FTAAPSRSVGQSNRLQLYFCQLQAGGDAAVLALEYDGGAGDSRLHVLRATSANSTWLAVPTVTNLGTGVSSRDLAAADFNGDNKIDVATANANASIGLFTGNGTGGFTFNSSLTLAHGAYGIVGKDLTNDGVPDLAVTHWTDDDSLTVFLSTGPLSFGSGVNYAAGARPKDIRASDVDSDGSVDLIVLNDVQGTASVPDPVRDATVRYGD